MTRIPQFEKSKVSTATSYHFTVNDVLGGWAIATINDATGELSIQSDWGNWAYRWSPNPKHLGAPTLTHFIADRNACDYLANKLDVGNGTRSGEEFDVDATVAKMRRRLCERRLDEARGWIEYYRDDGDEAPNVLEDPPSWATKKYIGGYYERDGGEPLTAGIAREIWDGLGSLLECGRSADLFCERYFNVYGNEWITNEPWEHLVFAPTFAHLVLVNGILPALVKACADTVKSRAA